MSKKFFFTISVMSSGFLFADTRYWNKKIIIENALAYSEYLMV
jgi:hypothetical protein